MKVLFVASYSGVSGASQSLVTLVKLLIKKGVEPLVLLPQSGPLEIILEENGIPYRKIRTFSWVTPLERYSSLTEKAKWFLKKMVNIIQEIRVAILVKRENIDIVHINAITTGTGYYAAKINKKTLIWHIREFLEEDLGKMFWNKKLSLKSVSKADVIVAISESVKSKYSQLFFNKNKLVKIYNGIATENYKSKRNDLFDGEQVVLTLAGRIVPNKGHEEAIYAIKNLIDNGVEGNIKLRFVGGEGQKEFARKLESLIISLNIQDYIEFSGYRTDMHNVWRETDITLVCSKSEAFGRVTVEAMMTGTLVIGSNTAGTAELISNQYGLLYEQGNYLSLAEKIGYALNHRNEMKVIASKASKYAMEALSAENNAENVHDLYRKYF